jgi:hypothetical protein
MRLTPRGEFVILACLAIVVVSFILSFAFFLGEFSKVVGL